MTYRLSWISVVFIMLTSCGSGENKKQPVLKDEKPEVVEAKQPGERHPLSDSLAAYLQEIQNFRSNDYREKRDPDYDVLPRINDTLQGLMKVLCSDVNSFGYSFDELDSLGLYTYTSDDSCFRIFCWNTETGGSMRYINAIAQYRNGLGSAAYVLNDINAGEESCGVYYNEIHTIETKKGKYYLVIYHGVFSGNDYSEGIRAYRIENGKLNDQARIFKTTNSLLYEISYDYLNHGYNEESADNRIHFNEDKTSLFIPVVNHGIVSGKSLVYKFDGNQFVFDKNAR